MSKYPEEQSHDLSDLRLLFRKDLLGVRCKLTSFFHFSLNTQNVGLNLTQSVGVESNVFKGQAISKRRDPDPSPIPTSC